MFVSILKAQHKTARTKQTCSLPTWAFRHPY